MSGGPNMVPNVSDVKFYAGDMQSVTFQSSTAASIPQIQLVRRDAVLQALLKELLERLHREPHGLQLSGATYIGQANDEQ